jgi:hypothetical protein
VSAPEREGLDERQQQHSFRGQISHFGKLMVWQIHWQTPEALSWLKSTGRL